MQASQCSKWRFACDQAEFYRRMWALGPAGSDVPLRLLQGAELRDLRVCSIDRMDYFKEKPGL